MPLNTSLNNPAANTLKANASESDITDAIAASGYPLQGVVAMILRQSFAVQEEWSFVDADERTVRAIDLIAERPLYEQQPDSRVRPTLDLIVECKRSDLPYVFFLSDRHVSAPQFPMVAGLRHSDITITTDDDPSSWMYDVVRVLGLRDHSFLSSEAVPCSTFTRCERSSRQLRLSGSEPYNAIVQPLIKALEHFRSIEAPPTTAVYFDLHLAIGLAVLDAPMVGVRPGALAEPLMVPWVRLPRHRGLDGVRSHEHRRNIYALDIVHVGFLETYVNEHLLPFAEEFARRTIKHQVPLAEGRGFVAGMGTHWYDDIEARLLPKKLRERAKRAAATVKGIARRTR